MRPTTAKERYSDFEGVMKTEKSSATCDTSVITSALTSEFKSGIAAAAITICSVGMDVKSGTTPSDGHFAIRIVGSCITIGNVLKKAEHVVDTKRYGTRYNKLLGIVFGFELM